MPRSKNRLLAYVLLLVSTALWGISPVIIKYSFSFTTPSLFLFFRFLIASILFLPIFLIYRSKTNHRINHPRTILIALLSTPLCLLPLYEGLNLTTSIEASLLDSASPIIIIVLCVLFLKETLRKKERIGLFLAIIGTLFIALEPQITGHNLVSLSVKGNFLILLSTVIWGVFILLSKKFNTNSVYLTFYSFIFSVPFFLFFAIFKGNSISLNPQAFPGIFFMATAGSIVAFWAYQEGQKRIEASEAAIFTYLKPAFTIPLSILWLKETFSPVAIIATILIIVGVFISEKS